MKPKFINLYMDWAKRAAELSHARRLHVGAVIVKDDTVISYGYNGMPAGWENDCEDEIGMGFGKGKKLLGSLCETHTGEAPRPDGGDKHAWGIGVNDGQIGSFQITRQGHAGLELGKLSADLTDDVVYKNINIGHDELMVVG